MIRTSVGDFKYEKHRNWQSVEVHRLVEQAEAWLL